MLGRVYRKLHIQIKFNLRVLLKILKRTIRIFKINNNINNLD